MKATLFVVALVAVWVAWYVLSCWWRPLARCLCCRGAGAHTRRDGRVFRECWWCRGSGRRWRVGRRVWDFFHRHAHT